MASICTAQKVDLLLDHFAEWFSSDAKSARIRGDVEETLFPGIIPVHYSLFHTFQGVRRNGSSCHFIHRPMGRHATGKSGTRKAREFGYQGLELACWGDHFEVDKAIADNSYCATKRDLLEQNDLMVHAISCHLVGQAVCDRVDERHKAILPPYIWGDGDPEGVQATSC